MQKINSNHFETKITMQPVIQFEWLVTSTYQLLQRREITSVVYFCLSLGLHSALKNGIWLLRPKGLMGGASWPKVGMHHPAAPWDASARCHPLGPTTQPLISSQGKLLVVQSTVHQVIWVHNFFWTFVCYKPLSSHPWCMSHSLLLHRQSQRSKQYKVSKNLLNTQQGVSLSCSHPTEGWGNKDDWKSWQIFLLENSLICWRL